MQSTERYFFIEEGDKKKIEKRVKNGELKCKLGIFFNWINQEHKLKKANLNDEERQLAEELKKSFPLDQWGVIKIISDHQKKYR